MNTRRTIDGAYFLSPNPVVNQLIEYALAYTAEKYRIQLNAHCSLSGHHHTVFFDPDGSHPEFRRELHSLITRSVNVHRNMQGARWAPDDTSPVVLLDVEATLERISYTISNMCSHDLVDDPSEWPGVVSQIKELAGEPKVVRKPSGFYDPEGKLPEYVLLRYEKPPALSDWTDEEYRAEISRRVAEKCAAAQARRKKTNKSVVGRLAVLAQNPTDTPKTKPVVGSRNPRAASGCANLRIAYLLWLKWFRLDHREARIAFESGDSGAEFPFGTYWHSLRYGVNCSTVGPPHVF